MADDSEAALDAWMARLADGDRSAFEPLFHALHARALRLARARVDAALAQDVAQAALLNVFARAHEFTPGRAALPWFYAIVANEIRSVRRRTRTHDSMSDEIAAALTAADPEELLLQRELMQAFSRALEALDEPALQAIQAMLGRDERPTPTAPGFRKRVSRAYARLRLLLGELR